MKSQQNVVHFVSSPREREKWDRIASGEEAKIKIQDVEKNKQQSINRRSTNMSNFSQPAASPVDPYHTLSLISIFSKKNALEFCGYLGSLLRASLIFE